MKLAPANAETDMPAKTATETRAPLPLALTRKVFEPVETHFTPGERSMVAWITTDCVDHERDVVVSSGVDYKTYYLGKSPEEGNPCVLAFHDLGRWPLGRCEWIKIKQSREFNGLYAKTVFDDDPETDAVWRKIRSRTLRGISIGFRPPDDLKPGEWGPPTREELARRPDWKGAERIIRRCVLLEYSVCSLPMNPQALVAAVSKGIHRPIFSTSTSASTPVPTAGAELEPGPGESASKSTQGSDERAHTLPSRLNLNSAELKTEAEAEVKAKAKVEAKPTLIPEPDSTEPSGAKAESQKTDPASRPEPTGAVEEEPAEEGPEAVPASSAPTSAEPIETWGPFRRFDPVSVSAPHYNGVGCIESFHLNGHVPDVLEDMIGTTDAPAARVRCYKPMRDGHVPTEDFVAARLADLSPRSAPFSSSASATDPTKSAAGLTGAGAGVGDLERLPLPRLIAKSDQEVRAELVARLQEMLSPEGFRRIAREEAERAAGYV